MKYLIPLLFLTGCIIQPTIDPTIVDNLDPEQCFWHGVSVHPNAVQTGIIVTKNQPHHIMGGFAATERECGEQYGWLLYGCVKAADGGDFPAKDHRYEIVYINKCSAVHEACHALYEAGNGAHALQFDLRQIQGDEWAACHPHKNQWPWQRTTLTRALHDDRTWEN